MQRTVTLIIRLGLLALCMAGSAQATELPDLIDRIRPSIVGVGTAYPPRQPGARGDRMTYTGTGFVVGNGRQVVTNVHVLPTRLDREHRQGIAVFAGHGASARAYMARELRRDEEHDLVLLEFQGPVLPAVQFGDSDAVREGQAVAFTGFPIGMALGLYPVTHRGIIAALTPMAQPVQNARELTAVQVQRMRNRYMAFQLDAIAYPGNSGSPVFDLRDGRVIAVINSVLVKESKETLLSDPSGISYAIPARYVVRLLAAGK